MEDHELRRLHYLAGMGAVAARMRDRYLELRSRDRRQAVREPEPDVVVVAPDEGAASPVDESVR